MSNHDHFPNLDQNTPVDHPYEAFPTDYALRSNLLVHRNVYDADGTIVPGATTTERGWTAVGTTVRKGVEYTRVAKLGESTDDGRYPQKDIPTDQLDRWQDMKCEAKQVADLGKEAVVAVAGETPHWEVHEQPVVAAPMSESDYMAYVNPMEDVITPDMLRKLREQVATSDSSLEAPAATGAEVAPDAFAGFKESLVNYASELINNPKTDPHTSASLLSRMISGEQGAEFSAEQRAGLEKVGEYLFDAAMQGSSPSARYATHEQVVGKARDMLRAL